MEQILRPCLAATQAADCAERELFSWLDGCNLGNQAGTEKPPYPREWRLLDAAVRTRRLSVPIPYTGASMW